MLFTAENQREIEKCICRLFQKLCDSSKELGSKYLAFFRAYSVDSIKHTVLLKVLLQIFLLVSIKSTVHWKFSRQINLRTVSIKNTVFNSVQCT